MCEPSWKWRPAVLIHGNDESSTVRGVPRIASEYRLIRPGPAEIWAYNVPRPFEYSWPVLPGLRFTSANRGSLPFDSVIGTFPPRPNVFVPHEVAMIGAAGSVTPLNCGPGN